MSDETLLRTKAREAIEARRLPQSRPERVWGGPGIGASCAICGERLGRNDTEFELQFAGGHTGGGLDTYHLHIGCFAAWELEREVLEPPRGAMSPEGSAQAPAGALRDLCNDGMMVCDGGDTQTRGEPA